MGRAQDGRRGGRRGVGGVDRIASFVGVRRAAAALLVVSSAVAAPARAQSSLPDRLSDADFRQLIATISEPGGYFRSDNFVSNETGFEWVIPRLQKIVKPGTVYLGVGPEQNFTYIVGLHPKMAIIVDIRRQNMVQHLMYKALMEMSPDRADFLSKLFSRPRPAGLDSTSTVDKLFEAYEAAAPDSAAYRKNLASITAWLSSHHGIVLGDSDVRSLEYVYGAFYDAGPDITYNYPNRGFGGRGGGMPDYATVQTATDSAGVERSYLATEANYRWLRDFETKNLLVPAVGDFAGPKALRAVGTYLRAHGATVMAFYTSNVEQYLFQQDDDWSRFYKNVATLPIDSTSMFIRSIGGRGMFGQRTFPPSPNARSLGMRAPNVVCSVQDLLKAFTAGRITSYYDVLELSR